MPRQLVEISGRIGSSHPSTKPRAIYELYEQYFAGLADRPLTLLELGVLTGDSLKVFASFFENGRIIGVDIEDRGINFLDYPNVIFARGDQRSAEQLNQICTANAPGGLDIIIDDASHIGAWSWQTYSILYPHLKPGGLYFVEDWLTGYWDDWPDGERFQEPAFEIVDRPLKHLPSHDFGMVGFVKSLVDQTCWHERPGTGAPLKKAPRLEFMHVHSQAVLLKKARA